MERFDLTDFQFVIRRQCIRAPWSTRQSRHPVGERSKPIRPPSIARREVLRGLHAGQPARNPDVSTGMSAKRQTNPVEVAIECMLKPVWYAPAKIVISRVQLFQSEVAQLRRYLTTQTVCLEIQFSQIGEVA